MSIVVVWWGVGCFAVGWFISLILFYHGVYCARVDIEVVGRGVVREILIGHVQLLHVFRIVANLRLLVQRLEVRLYLRGRR